jgi:hypothetical protein
MDSLNLMLPNNENQMMKIIMLLEKYLRLNLLKQ